ncbi:guanylate kinase [Ruegeria sp. TrichCH4B]|nr:guanylate kinase [Ruegeria sp. TrichCH4B]
MQKSWDEISHWGSYDHVLINEDLDATEEALKTIITATRLRRIQQPSLIEHARTLQQEFEDLS